MKVRESNGNKLIGKNILHYKIIEKLGEGGMGVVYRAEDTKLKREVAIKFLPRKIAVQAEERERFKIEAQAAAALNHPNIATIHAIEDVNDETFIVMEHIDGQELKQKIDAGPLQVDKAIDIATQIANGLQDIKTRMESLLRLHAHNFDSSGRTINKELKPISNEIKHAMWDLVDAIKEESKDGKA